MNTKSPASTLPVYHIKRLGINGEGIAYGKGLTVFIDGALPGEIVRAEITETRPKFARAELIEIVKPSPQRIKSPCPVYDICGGCQLQHLSQPAQLHEKELMLRETLQRYINIEPHQLIIKPMMGMDNPWSYRNKAQLQAGLLDGAPALGLYRTGSKRLVDISECPVHHPLLNKLMQRIRSLLQELKIPLDADHRTHNTTEGRLRTVIARVAWHSEQLQLTFIATASTFSGLGKLMTLLRLEFRSLVSIAVNINTSDSPLIFGEETSIVWGEERMLETLGDLTLALSPRAFYQLNPEQTLKLYQAVEQAAHLSGGETIVDAYCGSGSIGLWLAKHAKHVIGIEQLPEAITDAKRNAALNKLDHKTEWIVGRAEEWLPAQLQRIRADVIIVDPPRTGLGAPLLEAIIKMKPKRFIYVSCNPSTLAKDLDKLLRHGGRIDTVQPVDMFPQTSHIECVVSLTWVSSSP